MEKKNNRTKNFKLTNSEYNFENYPTNKNIDLIINSIRNHSNSFNTKIIEVETNLVYHTIYCILKDMQKRGIIQYVTQTEDAPNTSPEQHISISANSELMGYYSRKLNCHIFHGGDRKFANIVLDVLYGTEDKELTFTEINHLIETKYPTAYGNIVEKTNYLKTIINKMKHADIIGYDTTNIKYYLIEPENAKESVNVNDGFDIGTFTNDEVSDFTGGYCSTPDFDEPEDAYLGQEF